MYEHSYRVARIAKAAKIKQSYMDSMDTGMDDPAMANAAPNRDFISALSYTLKDLSTLKKMMARFNAAESSFKFLQNADDPVSLMRTYKFYPDFNEMSSGDFSKAKSLVKRVERHLSVLKHSLDKGSR